VQILRSKETENVSVTVMLNLYPLYSSSSGNMYLIESDEANILIDIGVTYKKVKEALNHFSKEPSNIDAIFITHEHSDHIKGLKVFTKSNPTIPIYSSIGTSEYLKKTLIKDNISIDNIHSLPDNVEVKIKDLCISHFHTSHDAVDPVGYEIKNRDKSITIATDLGMMTSDVFSHLKTCSLPVIETNYDKNMLLAGKYPFEIKRRIDGPYGHLSNEACGQVILKLAENGTRDFLLGHMSENNNVPELAKQTICSTLSLNGFNIDDFNINIATKNFSDEVYKL